jgi:hypothetical protein
MARADAQTSLTKRRQQVGLGFCCSHVWRKFLELAVSSAVETEVLRRIAMLYAIEGQGRGASAEQRRAARAERARVIIEDLRDYLEARLRQVSAKNKLAEAMRYVLPCKTGQSLILDDSRVELVSNISIGRSVRWL